MSNASDTTSVTRAPATLVGVLRARAAAQPEQTACLYLGDGEQRKDALSFSELDQQARAIAARLQGLGATGECAVLLYPPGLEFLAAFFGCLYAGVVAVPLPVPRLHGSMRQFSGIVEDLDLRVVLTTATTLTRLERLDAPALQPLLRICSEDTDAALARAWREPDMKAGDLAYLQYTSGSTGDRRGVMVSHANVLANLDGIAARFEHHAASVSVNWLPHFHDLGLVSGMLQPLYHGHLNVMMSPTAFVQQPIRWLNAISHYRGTYTNSPNYGYDLCLRRTTAAQREELDLSCWEVALNGAEPVRRQTLDAFAEMFAPCGFRAEAMYPAYGLAEATLVVTGGACRALPVIRTVVAAELERGRAVDVAPGHSTRDLVGCGPAIDATVVRIVDPDTHEIRPDGEIGEIWIAGPGVAGGYWRRRDETVEVFEASLRVDDGRRYLRSGDLGCLFDGELFVTGRLKDLIIIRGNNHYPQDIEWTVEQSHQAFRPGCTAAFAVDSSGEEHLVVVVEIERDHLRNLAVDELAALARRQVAEVHEISLHALVLLKTGTIPRTSSGKIQRRQCRADYLAGTLAVVGEARLGGAVEVADAAADEVAPVAAEAPARAASELCAWLRDYAAERLNSRLMDERRSLAPHVVLDFGNQGLLGLQAPRALGGLALGERAALRVIEQLGAIDLTLAMMTIVHNTLGIGPILHHAEPALRDTLVPRLASGRELAAFAITEPGAGSNPQAIATRAVPDDAGAWRLFGEKCWSGTAGWASVINVFALHLDDAGQAQGLSGFVLPRSTPGLHMGAEALTFGMRAMVQNAIHLDGARVTRTQSLGAPGTGMAVAQDAMMQGRLAIAAACVGGIKRCLQLLSRYAQRRTIATGRLLDNPVVLERIGDLSASVAALEALVAGMAERLEAGLDVPVDCYVVCKTAGPERLWQAADTLMQFLGGRGYIETNEAARLLRDARVTRILEGPTEALLMYLGSRVINESDGVMRYLRDVLGAGAVADRLATAAADIHARCTEPGARFGGAIEGRRWAYALIGEVATEAVLLAAAPACGVRHAAAWAELRFEQTLARALTAAAPRDAGFDAARAAAVIAGYGDTIGDFDQSLPGEDHTLDPWLRRDHEVAAGSSALAAPGPSVKAIDPVKASPTPVASAVATASSGAANEVRRLERFIVHWVAQEMKLDPKAIDSAGSLLDYGIDSVTAVMLGVALEDELGIELHPEVVYHHPVIRDLARYVAAQPR